MAVPGMPSPWSTPQRWKKKWERWRFEKQLLAASSWLLAERSRRLVLQRGLLKFQQIPQIPVQIFKHRDRSIHFFAWRSSELNSSCHHLTVVSPEVVSVQEEKHSAAGLVADSASLFRRCCPSQKQAGAA